MYCKINMKKIGNTRIVFKRQNNIKNCYEIYFYDYHFNFDFSKKTFSKSIFEKHNKN